MSRRGKWVMCDIEKREVRDGVVVRVLSCGHEVAQSQGGKVKLATTAKCLVCTAMRDVRQAQKAVDSPP